MEIKELCVKAHENARGKGFWLNEEYVEHALKHNRHAKMAFQAQKMMLIVSELGEALEALRQDDQENLAEEMADTCIRIFDFCGGYGIDIEKAIQEKMEINKDRPPKHGKEF